MDFEDCFILSKSLAALLNLLHALPINEAVEVIDEENDKADYYGNIRYVGYCCRTFLCQLFVV